MAPKGTFAKGTFLGLTLDINREEAVKRAMERMEARAERVKRTTERADAAIRSQTSSAFRQGLSFAGRELFVFAANETLRDIIGESNASETTAFVTGFGSAIVSGGLAGTVAGVPGAIIGAGLQAALFLGRDALSRSRRNETSLDALRKATRDADLKLDLKITQISESLSEFNQKVIDELNKRFERFQDESEKRLYNFSRLVARRAG